MAQSKSSSDPSQTAPTSVSPDDVDHYDPDDTKEFDDVVSQDRTVRIRDRDLTLHLYTPKSGAVAVPVIYACGDGGWRGLAPRTAQQLAHMGAAVVGLDSKVYLRELSSKQNPLTIKQLALDYVELASVARESAKVDGKTPVFVYGWSLGAGFAIAVGSEKTQRDNWAGIVAIGLPSKNQLISGLGANYLDLRNPTNMRYGFRSDGLIGSISPLPLVMIESTSDSASPQKVSKVLFADARDPKQFVLIKASNHRFSGAREEFYSALTNALQYIKEARAAGQLGKPGSIAGTNPSKAVSVEN